MVGSQNISAARLVTGHLHLFVADGGGVHLDVYVSCWLTVSDDCGSGGRWTDILIVEFGRCSEGVVGVGVDFLAGLGHKERSAGGDVLEDGLLPVGRLTVLEDRDLGRCQ